MYFGRSRSLQYKFAASKYLGLEFVGQHRTLLTSKRSIAMTDSRSEICEFSKSFKTDLKSLCIYVQGTYMVVNVKGELVVLRDGNESVFLSDAFAVERVSRRVANDLVVVTRTNGTIDLIRVDSSSLSSIATASLHDSKAKVVSAKCFQLDNTGYLSVVSMKSSSSYSLALYKIEKTSIKLSSSVLSFRLNSKLKRVAVHTSSSSSVLFTCLDSSNKCTTFRVRDGSIHTISEQTFQQTALDIMDLDEMLLIVFKTSMSLWSSRFGVMLETDTVTKDHSVTCLSRSYTGTKIAYVSMFEHEAREHHSLSLSLSLLSPHHTYT